MINACITQGVEQLVYTSSISAVFDGLSRDDSINEERALRENPTPISTYGHCKKEAEALIRAAHGRGVTRTIALRPDHLFGPRDRLVTEELCLTPKSVTHMGNECAIHSMVYVKNLVEWHLCAARHLARTPDSPVGGHALFVGNTDGTIPQHQWRTQVMRRLSFNAFTYKPERLMRWISSVTTTINWYPCIQRNDRNPNPI